MGRPEKYHWASVDWLLADKEIATLIGAPRGVVRNKRLALGKRRGKRTSNQSRALASMRLKQRWAERRESMLAVQRRGARCAAAANRKKK